MRPGFFTARRATVALFVIFLALFLFTRLQVFLIYNLRFIDTDQPYMWLGAVDFSKGCFYEPRYYGQSYNTFMEALFAVPLLWLGAPVYAAATVATHVISAFPFLFTAFFLFKKGKRIHALLVLALLLCMAPHYDLLNSLPRGFVTGLFFCSFFVVSVLEPGNVRAALLNTALAVTGYFVNPNSVVVSAPLLVYLFLHHRRQRALAAISLTAILTAGVMYLVFDLFYDLHPGYIQNPIDLAVTTGYFFENLANLDQRFAHIALFTENRSWATLLVIGAAGTGLAISHRAGFIAFMAFIAVILFSFCVGKTTEGAPWVYISYSRMYLGIPLFIALFLPLIRFPATVWWIMVIPFAAGLHKVATMTSRLEGELDPRRFVGVRVYSLPEMLRNIEMYHGVCRHHRLPLLLVSHDFWLANVIAYGGPATRGDYPQTLETRLDKRYRVREMLRDSVVPRFLFVSTHYALDEKLPATGWFSLTNFGYGTFLVENNTLPMSRFCGLVDAYERR